MALLTGALLAGPLLCAPVAAQGVLLPPGEIPRPNTAVPGAAHPTPYQLFSPQQAMPAPFQGSGAPQAQAAPAAPQATAPHAAASPAPAAQASAAPVPMPTPRPAGADAAPAVQTAAAPSRPAPASSAPTAIAPVQQDQDRAGPETLQKVSDYWNRVQVLSGNFVQVDPDGSRKTGDFYMQKPGRVRFEYDAPVPLELISNGQSVAVRDRKLNTQDITPLSQTPLRFLLADNIDLARNPNVVGAFKDNLYVTVVMEEKVPMLGTYKLLLLFDAKDYTLRQWIVTDPQGYDTSVAVSRLNYNARPDPKLFVINFDRMLQ
ncbi:LolA family protein [Aquabacter cavernae]|uniref:LolA family protein n=1 Tax=Aquabacter cavernae TaxID=2496029 RepID=UPI001FE12F9B|nr:outer-membrane lipoprotein carrier protein LolA [Aquabacter cavernae]